MPLNFVRFGDDAPVAAGTYVHVGELRAWARLVGFPILADMLEDFESAPATTHHEIASILEDELEGELEQLRDFLDELEE